MEIVRHSFEQGLQKGDSGRSIGFLMQLGKSELRRAVDADVEMQLPLSGAHLGDVDAEIADRVDLEALLLSGLSFKRW